MKNNSLSEKAVATYVQNEASKRELKIIHPILSQLLGDVNGKKVVDYGCGEGKLMIELYDRGAEVYGYDLSSGMIQEARKRFSQQNKLATLATIKSGEIPLEDGNIDAVVSNLALHMISNLGELDQVFREINRISVPNAPFVFCLPHPCFADRNFPSYHNNLFNGFDYFETGLPYQFVLHLDDGRELSSPEFINHLYRLEEYFDLLLENGYSLEKFKEIRIRDEKHAPYLIVKGVKTSPA